MRSPRQAAPARIVAPARIAALAPIAALALIAAGPAPWRDIPPPTPTAAHIPYGHTASGQWLNLYLPAGAGPFPLVVAVHGGAFIYGDANNVAPGFANDVAALNARGIAVASVGYRLAPRSVFPKPVRDLSTALAFLAAHAAHYHLDSARIALWGKSAGANLVLLAGLGRHAPRFRRPGLAVPPIAAIVAYYPPTDFLTLDQELRQDDCRLSGPFLPHDGPRGPESKFLGVPIKSHPARDALADPATYATQAAPPVLLVAGTDDCLVPWQQSQELANTLIARGAPVTFRLVTGATHADLSLDQGATLATTMNFLTRALHVPRPVIEADRRHTHMHPPGL